MKAFPNLQPAEGKAGEQRAELDEPVHLSEYDPAWPALFVSEAERIRPCLPHSAVIEHIGSTSVEGLIAKPIIDILVGVSRQAELSTVRTRLGGDGYFDFGEAGVPGRIYLRRRTNASFNLHLTLRDGRIWRANLAFRNYLRTDLAAAREYGLAKRAALDSGCKTLLAYSDHKRAITAKLVCRALEHLQRSKPESE